MIKNKKRMVKHLVVYFAFISLSIALIIGFFLKDRDLSRKMEEINRKGSILKIISSDKHIKIGKFCENENGNIKGYVALTEGMGWGGPFISAVITDSNGTIDEIIVIDHKETHSYFRKLQRKDFFKQFSDKKVSDPFDTGDGVDMVSGATISSLSFTDAIRKSCYKLGTEVLGFEIKRKRDKVKIEFKEVLLLFLYILVFVAMVVKSKMLRYIVVIAGFVLLGIVFNTSISIAGLSSIMLGYFPLITKNLFWWFFIPGILFIALSIGKNIYCHWICPFGAAQELISKISGIKIVVNKKVDKIFNNFRYFLTWLSLIIIFLTQNPAMGTYEPFATLFGFEGIGIQWLILSVVLFGAYIIPLFWCRFFCPVKVILQTITKLHFHIKKIPRKLKNER